VALRVGATNSRMITVIPARAVAVAAAAELRLVPALIAAAGWRYVEFFTANIRNLNTRRGVPLPIPADAILILPGLALA
jgi:hypothetical protein